MNDRTREILNLVVSPEIKVVSFDIFDTLLVRPVVSPTDLFHIVKSRTKCNYNFKEMRMMAERVARLNKPYYEDDITFDDIYNEFSKLYTIDSDELELLKKTELEVELDYLSARETIKIIFEEAKAAGKEVIVTSDMYLPKSFLEEALKKNGYEGYSHFYLSCEEKLAKGTGKLFQKIIVDYEKKGISSHEIIHIGDNKKADVDQAKKNKLRAYHTPSPISIFNSKKKLAPLIKNLTNTDNTFLIGYIANFLFDDPYQPFDVNSYFGNSLSNMGNILFGPLLVIFTKWMIEDAISEQIDVLNFAYRDGYIPLQIYTKLSQCYPDAPSSNIVYLTRAMRYNYYSKKKNGFYEAILDLPPSPDMPLIKFVENRLLITDTDEKKQVLSIFEKNGYENENSPIGPLQKYITLIKDIESNFIDNASKNIEDIDNYCIDIFEKGKKHGIFDVGYRGSVSRHIKDYFGINNVGYHLFSLPLMKNYSKEYQLKSLISYGFSLRTETQILHQLIEDVISIQEGSTIHVSKKGEGYNFIRQDASYSEELSKIQESIIAFANGFISKFKNDIVNMNFDEYLFFDVLISFLKQPFIKDAILIRDMSFVDSAFISAQTQNAYKNWYNSKFNTVKHQNHANNTNAVRLIIYKTLLKIGLLPYAKKVLNFVRKISGREKNNNSNIIATNNQFVHHIEKSISEITTNETFIDKKTILVAGNIVSFDKGVCNYLNNIASSLSNNTKLFLLSEATLATKERTAAKILFDFIITPNEFGKDQYIKGLKLKITPLIAKALKEKKYLSLAAENLKKRHPDMGNGYPEVLVYYSEKYFQKIIDIYKPEIVILWNKFHALHQVFTKVCENNNIKLLFMEFGVLPGTLSIEKIGQMGESFPSKYFNEFLNLKVNEADLDKADQVLSLLRTTKLNRNLQPINNMKDNLLKQIDPNKPIIFYAGQNDFESGLFPYTAETKESHSPIFSSSDSAAIYLANLAKKNNWNFIYKPHPLMYNLNNDIKASLPENVLLVSDIDINDLIDISDVTITILSQTGYISTIRRCPTVMLGYTQLKGKGCTYEAFQSDEIEIKIKNALEYGFTTEQEDAFRIHVAQLIKYYLYDDLVKKDIQYGRSVENCIDFLYEQIFVK